MSPSALRRQVGQLLIAGFNGHQISPELRSLAKEFSLGGVILFARNVAEPEQVAELAFDAARLGAAIVRTLQAEGIAACGKHFPGHGDTSTDSHVELPLVEHPPDRLRQVEFIPFKAAVDAGVATIMTAHVLVPAIDEKRPAT